MAVKFKSLRRDVQKQDEGDWVPLPEFTDPVTGEVPELLVRGINFSRYQTARSEVIRKFATRYGAKAVPYEEGHSEDGRILAKFILLGWRNAAEPYDPELAEEMLRDPGSSMQDYVRRCAVEVAEVQAKFTSDAEGNSARSSVGSSNLKAAAA